MKRCVYLVACVEDAWLGEVRGTVDVVVVVYPAALCRRWAGGQQGWVQVVQ